MIYSQFVRLKKIFFTGIVLFCLMVSPAQTQFSSATNTQKAPGPISMEPAVEKNGVRVTLRSNIQRRNQMQVLVKVSNFSEQPVLVSPDAVETTTGEGFVILPSNGLKASPSDAAITWSRISRAATLIPFADPYQVISKSQKVADFAKKSGLWDQIQNSQQKKTFQLKEVILQPGMATHGLIVYDASSLNAFEYNPMLHIKIMINGEPFEFVFDSTPLKQSSKN